MTEMTPGPDDFKALLQLQECDTQIDQLRHKREHLPAHEVVADVEARAVALRPLLTDAIAKRDEQAAKQASLEAEVEAIEKRVAEINKRLYGDSPVPSKDAQAMLDEIKHLESRRTSLEDDELAVMEALEPLREHAAAFESQAHGLAQEMKTAQGDIVSGQAEVDVELAAAQQDRARIASTVTSHLQELYDRLRPKLSGVAVARLMGSSCGGCHLTLSASEVDRMRRAPADEVLYCEECGRILVR